MVLIHCIRLLSNLTLQELVYILNRLVVCYFQVFDDSRSVFIHLAILHPKKCEVSLKCMDELIHDLHFLGPSWAACLYHRETCFEFNYFFIPHRDLP